MVLGKDKNTNKLLTRLTKEKRERSQIKIGNAKTTYYWYYRNTNVHETLLWTIIHKQIGQPRRTDEFL